MTFILLRPRSWTPKRLGSLLRDWGDLSDLSTLTLIDALRFSRTANHYLTTPHTADLNATTELTIEQWSCQRTLNSDVVFAHKGAYNTTGGWCLAGGDAVASSNGVRLWSGSGAGGANWASIRTPYYTAAQALSKHVTRFNAGTVAINRNGTVETLTGATKTPLATNTLPLNIGPGATTFFSGYKSPDFDHVLTRIWTRDIGSTAAAALLAGDLPIPYASLDSGLLTNLVTDLEGASKICRHTARVFSDGGTGSIDAVKLCVEVRDKSPWGRVRRAVVGAAPTYLATGLNGGPCLQTFDQQGMVGTMANLLDQTSGDIIIAHQFSQNALEQFAIGTESANPADIKYFLVGSTPVQSLPPGFTPPGGSCIPFVRINNGGGGNNYGSVYAGSLFYTLNQPYLSNWRGLGSGGANSWKFRRNGVDEPTYWFSVVGSQNNFGNLVTNQGASRLNGLGTTAAGQIAQSMFPMLIGSWALCAPGLSDDWNRRLEAHLNKSYNLLP